MREEWQRRQDDVVAAADLMAMLKTIHPAYVFSHDALVFLTAFMREFNEELVSRCAIVHTHCHTARAMCVGATFSLHAGLHACVAQSCARCHLAL